MSGGYVVFGTCWTCGKSFTFNPELVPSIFIDPMTSLPPDVDEHSKPQEPDAEAIERAVRQPLCAECVERSNVERVEQGQEPIPILPGAYEWAEGLPS